MARTIQIFLAILAGLATALALVVAVEAASAVVHPTPEGFSGTQEEMCEHVARYPQWVLAVVVVAWNATGFMGGVGRHAHRTSASRNRSGRVLVRGPSGQRDHAALSNLVQAGNDRVLSGRVLVGHKGRTARSPPG